MKSCYNRRMVEIRKQQDLVIVPPNVKPRPEAHELRVARILARYFDTSVEFIPRSNVRTADLHIDGITWEIKSPTGSGKNNIQHQMQDASHQSANVIIDASRSKMHGLKIKSQVAHQFKIIKTLKRVIFISKQGIVFELQR